MTSLQQKTPASTYFPSSILPKLAAKPFTISSQNRNTEANTTKNTSTKIYKPSLNQRICAPNQQPQNQGASSAWSSLLLHPKTLPASDSVGCLVKRTGRWPLGFLPFPPVVVMFWLVGHLWSVIFTSRRLLCRQLCFKCQKRWNTIPVRFLLAIWHFSFKTSFMLKPVRFFNCWLKMQTYQIFPQQHELFLLISTVRKQTSINFKKFTKNSINFNDRIISHQKSPKTEAYIYTLRRLLILSFWLFVIHPEIHGMEAPSFFVFFADTALGQDGIWFGVSSHLAKRWTKRWLGGGGYDLALEYTHLYIHKGTNPISSSCNHQIL